MLAVYLAHISNNHDLLLNLWIALVGMLHFFSLRDKLCKGMTNHIVINKYLPFSQQILGTFFLYE